MVETRARYSLDQINQMSLLTYARTMAVVFANASWVPVLAFPHRPFRSLPHLYESLTAVFRGSDENSQLQVIDQQPDLVNPPPPEDGAREFQLFQCDLEFHKKLSPDEKSRLETLQKEYLEKFGFILVFSPAGKAIPDLIAQITSRLTRTFEEEVQQAIEEASQLARARLEELLLPQ